MPARNLSEARASIEAFEKRKSQWPPARHARATASPPAPPIKTPPIKKPPIKKNPVKPPPPKRSSPKKWVLHLNVTKTLVNNRKVGGLSPLLGHFRLDAKDLPLDVTWKCGEETWVRKVRKERRDPRCGQVSSTGWSPIVKALQLQVGDKLQLLPGPGPREVLLSRLQPGNESDQEPCCLGTPSCRGGDGRRHSGGCPGVRSGTPCQHETPRCCYNSSTRRNHSADCFAGEAK